MLSRISVSACSGLTDSLAAVCPNFTRKSDKSDALITPLSAAACALMISDSNAVLHSPGATNNFVSDKRLLYEQVVKVLDGIKRVPVENLAVATEVQ